MTLVLTLFLLFSLLIQNRTNYFLQHLYFWIPMLAETYEMIPVRPPLRACPKRLFQELQNQMFRICFLNSRALRNEKCRRTYSCKNLHHPKWAKKGRNIKIYCVLIKIAPLPLDGNA